MNKTLKNILMTLGFTGLTTAATSCANEGENKNADAEQNKTEVKRPDNPFERTAILGIQDQGISLSKKGKKNAPDSLLSEVTLVYPVKEHSIGNPNKVKNVKYRAATDNEDIENIAPHSYSVTPIISKPENGNKYDEELTALEVDFKFEIDEKQKTRKEAEKTIGKEDFSYFYDSEATTNTDDWKAITRPETYSASHSNSQDDYRPESENMTITIEGNSYDFTPAEQMAKTIIKQGKETNMPPLNNPKIARVQEALIDLKEKRRNTSQTGIKSKPQDKDSLPKKPSVKQTGPNRTRNQLKYKQREVHE